MIARTIASLSNVFAWTRVGAGLLLGLALVMMGTPAAAQTNTDGLEFTGDALAEVPSHTAIDSISSGLTVELWVKHNGESDTDAVLVGNKTDLRNGSGFAMHLEDDGEDVRVAFRPSGNTDDHVVSNTALEKGRWYHLAGTYEKTSDGSSTSLYLNGELDATNTDNFFNSGEVSNSNSLYLGSRAGNGNFFRGGVDDVRIWGRALSKVAIDANFTGERSGTEDGLVAYFKLNENSGSSFANEVTSTNGSITGSGRYSLNAPGALPVAPAGVHAKPGDGEVTVYFNRPSYAPTSVSNYTVYRTESGGSRKKIGTAGASESTFTDTSPQDSTLYFYEVTAVTSSDDTSDYSEQTHATLTDRSGLRFSGGNVSFNKTASQENLESGTEMGVDFWVKYDENSDKDAVLFTNKSSTGSSGYTAQFVGGGDEVRIAFKPSSDSDEYVTSNTTLKAGRWYHIAATYTQTSDGTRTKLFINGEEDQSSTDNFFNEFSSDSPLVLGAASDGGNVFQGSLSEMRLWSTASISPSSLISQSLIGNESDLVTYFRFDEPGGSSVVRSSARPLSGTLPTDVTLDTPGPRPSAPITVRTRPVNGNVELHFQQPSYTQASISNYTVYRTEKGGQRTQIATTDTTVYTDANASAGTLYNYEVTANTLDGRESDFSVEEPATTYSNPGGNALELSGTSSFVDFPKTPSLENLENGTAIGLDFWVKHSGESDSSAVLIGNKNSLGDTGYIVHLIGGGDEVRIAFKPSSDSDEYVTSNTTLKTGRWYHIAATYTQTSDGTRTKLFINGEEEQSSTDNFFNGFGSDNPLVIGGTADGSSNFFQGSIDEVRLWSTSSLTPSSLKDQILIGNEEQLVGYWRFNEPSGSNVARSSAKPLTGTISNGAFIESNVYAVPPSIAFSPESLDFGEVRDDTSKTDTVTVENNGGSTLEGDLSFTDGTAFSVAGSSSYSLTGGEQRQVEVTFAPDSVRTFQDDLTITHNGDSTGSPVNVSLQGVGISPQLAGTVWYPATSGGDFVVTGRALNGVTVQAAAAEDTLTTTTGSDGSYAFMDIPSQEYTLSVKAEGDSGHVETGDAFRTIQGYVGAEPFVNGFQTGLADIDGDGVSASDALEIERFWLGRRSSFPVGSWQSGSATVSLTESAAKDVPLWAAQTGDVRLDGSSTGGSKATPLLAAGQSTAKSAGTTESKSVEAGTVFEVPVRLDQQATLGAYGLALEYPAEKATFQGASGLRSSLKAQSQDGTVRLSWFDQSGGENPIEAQAGSPVVTLTFRAASDLGEEAAFDLTVAEGEFAGAEGQSLGEVQLTTPAVTLGAPTPDEFALRGNYPNPFRQSTQIQVDLPSDTEVSVAVYNVLGQRVMRTEKKMSAGSAQAIPIDATHLSSGTYFYRVRAEVDGTTVKETGRMVQVR